MAFAEYMKPDSYTIVDKCEDELVELGDHFRQYRALECGEAESRNNLGLLLGCYRRLETYHKRLEIR